MQIGAGKNYRRVSEWPSTVLPSPSRSNLFCHIGEHEWQWSVS
jgi:hypothetical protein